MLQSAITSQTASPTVAEEEEEQVVPPPPVTQDKVVPVISSVTTEDDDNWMDSTAFKVFLGLAVPLLALLGACVLKLCCCPNEKEGTVEVVSKVLENEQHYPKPIDLELAQTERHDDSDSSNDSDDDTQQTESLQ